MKTCNPIEFWSSCCFFLKPTLMPLTVQYLYKSWIVKLLNFVGELLKLNLAEEYAFEVLDRTLLRIVIVTINISFTTSGAL